MTWKEWIKAFLKCAGIGWPVAVLFAVAVVLIILSQTLN